MAGHERAAGAQDLSTEHSPFPGGDGALPTMNGAGSSDVAAAHPLLASQTPLVTRSRSALRTSDREPGAAVRFNEALNTVHVLGPAGVRGSACTTADGVLGGPRQRTETVESLDLGEFSDEKRRMRAQTGAPEGDSVEPGRSFSFERSTCGGSMDMTALEEGQADAAQNPPSERAAGAEPGSPGSAKDGMADRFRGSISTFAVSNRTAPAARMQHSATARSRSLMHVIRGLTSARLEARDSRRTRDSSSTNPGSRGHTQHSGGGRSAPSQLRIRTDELPSAEPTTAKTILFCCLPFLWPIRLYTTLKHADPLGVPTCCCFGGPLYLLKKTSALPATAIVFGMPTLYTIALVVLFKSTHHGKREKIDEEEFFDGCLIFCCVLTFMGCLALWVTLLSSVTRKYGLYGIDEHPVAVPAKIAACLCLMNIQIGQIVDRIWEANRPEDYSMVELSLRSTSSNLVPEQRRMASRS